ncbi:PEGA domain protein [Pyrolobus fumarii 1A]|uniref:PEGA domain protein n=1 Tax=Pyrolobus fumarii (strain DSM 11204 / 1A) TaxID=694429 RepID=G0EFJ0_PYRF1|nr:carboxypeptidase regulatory-like domain-containing protein [Pyrolobus fumarii]AEM39014.1 PEGA domain protein [Pyrolobus fumarii 1A]
MAVRLAALIVATLITLILHVVVAHAQLPPYKPPYIEVQVPGRVATEYFDGGKLWVVYEQGGETHIALYTLVGGVPVQQWVSSVPGEPIATATTDDLSLLAVATSAKKIVVYDVSGLPILEIERGVRGKPLYVALASRSGGKVDTLIVVEVVGGSSYWVYAYALDRPAARRAELWLPVPSDLTLDRFKVVPVRVAARETAEPEIAVVRVVNVELNYTGTVVEGDYALVAEVYRVTDAPGGLVFVKSMAGNVTLGYEVGREPYTISSIDSVVVYRFEGSDTLYLLASLTLQQASVPGVTKTQLPGNIYGFVVADLSRNESIVRYEDSSVGTLDFYPMAGPARSFAVTSDGGIIAVGSSDYNVYMFFRGVDAYRVRYSISLGSSVTTVDMTPIGNLVVAGASNGALYAFNGGDGEIYWSLPSQSSVTSATITASYAAFGTEGGRVIAFTNPRVKLYYLGVQLNLTNAPDYVLEATTNITVVGVYHAMLVNISVSGVTSELVERPFFALLPAANYTLIVDNEVLGVVVYSVTLSANVVYWLQPEAFKLPVYTLTVCLLDTITRGPPADALLRIEQVPFPGQNETSLAVYTLPFNETGCASARLPRGYYTIGLLSWRYPPVIEGAPHTIRLWSDTLIRGNVTPYTARVTVSVATSYGMPLAGATVTLYDPTTGLEYNATTSGTGTVVIDGVAYGAYRVRIHHPHMKPYETRLLVNESSVALSATLKPETYFVTIMAVDAETGAPVEGLTIKITRVFDGYTVSVTVEKSYYIARLEYGEYRVEIVKTGYQPYTASFTADHDMRIEARLTPILYTVTIQVVDSLYQRSLPARIVVFNPETGRRLESVTATGVATLQLRAGSYVLRAYSPYAHPATKTFIVPGADRIVVELVPRNFTVVVTPIDSLADVPIALLGYNASGVIECSDTGEWSMEWVNGSLVATLPYSRGCRVTIQAPYYNPLVETIGDIGANTTLRVALEPVLYTLVIRARSEYGIPTSFNATVTGGPLNERFTVSGRGEATLRLRPGVYTVRVTAKYHEANETRVVVEGDTSVTVTLPLRVYTVTLRAIDSTTGNLVTGATAVLTRVAPTQSKPVVLDLRAGTARIPLTWGTYKVRISAPGYAEKTVTFTVPEATSVAVPLDPLTFTLRLRVVDALTNEPIGNATVMIFGVRTGTAVKALTDKTGSLKLSLRSDTYRIVVLAEYHLGAERQVTLLNDTELTVKLEPVKYTLTLRVSDGVTLKPFTGKWYAVFERKEGGFKENMTFEGPEAVVQLPYGTYKVVLGAPRYDKNVLNVELYNDTTLKAAIPRKRYTVTIKVLDARGSPVPNAIVTLTLTETGAQLYTGVTGDDGTVTPSLPWGTYRLTIEAGGYHPYTTIVTVKEEGQTIPAMIRPTLAKIILDLLPAIIIAGAVIGSAAWIGIRVRRKPVSLELLEEESE